ncbi:hypothetical protein B296_00054009 [Ensete ventricosum]|uniref:Uncharacterized protein n=1 Tax=Ensete ventricosum TaxID=4639 RepID=A0A426Y5K5_ENSVE|nr:hypothetical protein B296_00054009 [Ensete ventricosum]
MRGSPRNSSRWSAKLWYSSDCGIAGVTTINTTKIRAAAPQAHNCFLLSIVYSFSFSLRWDDLDYRLGLFIPAGTIANGVKV